MSRTIAIINDKEENSKNVSDIVSVLMANAAAEEILVYTKFDPARFNISHERCRCSGEHIPDEYDNEPKVRNWINSRHLDAGFFHIIHGSVQVLADPTRFMGDLENMMSVLDYSVWFSTVTDGCNYVYSKYNPRMRIACDRPECEKLGLSCGLAFTSHSNTQWIVYDMPKVKATDLIRFDDRFTIPMFFIIEFLARRRNTKRTGQLFYMNQYLTVGSEKGIFKNLNDSDNGQPSPELMRSEDELFRSFNIDFQPDNNIDRVLEDLWEKISIESGNAQV